jgi:hypothetical protein
MFIYSLFQSMWNVAKTKNFASMFLNALSYNKPMGSWQLTKAKSLKSMFQNAKSFSQDLNAWGAYLTTTAGVTNMFKATSCTTTADPNLSATPKGPFCWTIATAADIKALATQCKLAAGQTCFCSATCRAQFVVNSCQPSWVGKSVDQTKFNKKLALLAKRC